MAITIDQFLRDFTEGQLLSGEEAHAFRRQLSENAQRHPRDAMTTGRAAVQGGTVALEAPSFSPILSDCLVLEKIHQEQGRLIFSARRLKNNKPVVLHIFPFPNHRESAARPQTEERGLPEANASGNGRFGIVEVDRHGPLVSLCCERRNADTLADVIAENGPLPSELAGECLLQTAQFLKRFCEQGISLNMVSPEDLLLDEDGQISISGHQINHFSSWDACQCEGHALPMDEMLKSLGGLYHFLRTGGSPPRDLKSEPPGNSQSANRIEAKLFGQDAGFRYESWNGLVEDLKTMLMGNALESSHAESPAPAMVAKPEVAKPPSASPVPARRNQAPAPSKQAFASSTAWLLAAALGGAVLAALMLLNN